MQSTPMAQAADQKSAGDAARPSSPIPSGTARPNRAGAAIPGLLLASPETFGDPPDRPGTRSGGGIQALRRTGAGPATTRPALPRAALSAVRAGHDDGPGVIRRLTSAEVFPAGSGTRYSKIANFWKDVAPVDDLPGGATFAPSDMEPSEGLITVPVGVDDPPITVALKFTMATTGTYVPTQFTLTENHGVWTAAVSVFQSVTPGNLMPALTREFTEIALRVKAAAGNGGTPVAGDGDRAVFVPGPTPHGTAATSNDRATALSLVSLWKTASENLEDPRVKKALDDAGLGNPRLLPPTDVKFRHLEEAGGFDMMTALLAPSHEKTFTDAGGFPAKVVPAADLFSHLITPEFVPGTFATTGLKGGHLEPILKQVAEKSQVHLVQVGAQGTYRKYHQYRWTGVGAMPAPADRPTAASPPSPNWTLAKDDADAPVPKSTFTDLQVFLRDALAAFQSWTTVNPVVAVGKANGDFGLSTPAAISLTTGQNFGGYYDYSAAGGGSWTIRTIFPIL